MTYDNSSSRSISAPPRMTSRAAICRASRASQSPSSRLRCDVLEGADFLISAASFQPGFECALPTLLLEARNSALGSSEPAADGYRASPRRGDPLRRADHGAALGLRK